MSNFETYRLNTLSEAQSIGDTAEFINAEETIKWVVRIEHDEEASINDYECDGRVSMYVGHWDRDQQRPDGFTGRARKIDVDRSGYVWWEPYDGQYGWQEPDGEGGVEWHYGTWEQLPTAEQQRQVRRITDLVQNGFVGITVEHNELCNMGHWHVVKTASVWGIDTMDGDYGREVIGNLLNELDES